MNPNISKAELMAAIESDMEEIQKQTGKPLLVFAKRPLAQSQSQAPATPDK
jgi:hypothetical protein